MNVVQPVKSNWAWLIVFGKDGQSAFFLYWLHTVEYCNQEGRLPRPWSWPMSRLAKRSRIFLRSKRHLWVLRNPEQRLGIRHKEFYNMPLTGHISANALRTGDRTKHIPAPAGNYTFNGQVTVSTCNIERYSDLLRAVRNTWTPYGFYWDYCREPLYHRKRK